MSGGAPAGGPPCDPRLRSLLWRGVGRFLFRWTFRTWYGPRRLILKLFGTRLTPRTKFRRTVRVDRPWNVSAGTLTVIGDDVVLRARLPITIGDRCVVSQLAVITTERRDHATVGFPTVAAPITLEDDVWIATDTLVLPGSTVGAGTVVGARGLVDGELPGWMIATGEPAVPRQPRVLKTPEAAP
ncbi:MAG: LbetaH domain-containing protein [Planctomycetota bacterium]